MHSNRIIHSTVSFEWYVPAQFTGPGAKAHMKISGHKSIANTIIIHPVFPIIMSAGIERDILMHSPSPSSPSGYDFPLTSTDAREIPEASIYTNRRLMATLMDIDTPLQPEEDHGVDENGRVIALFDE